MEHNFRPVKVEKKRELKLIIKIRKFLRIKKKSYAWLEKKIK